MRRISSISELDEIIKQSGLSKLGEQIKENIISTLSEQVYGISNKDDDEYIDKDFDTDTELRQSVSQQRESVFHELEEKLNKQTSKELERDKLMEAMMLAEVIGTPRCRRGRYSRRNFIKR